MGRRLGQLTGLIAFALVIGRLGRLLSTEPGDPRWQLILIASAFLGGIVWWLLRQAVRQETLSYVLFWLGAAILFLRIAVPDTLAFGLLPTGETWPALVLSVEEAIDDIRFGIPPVTVQKGVVAILAVIMWAVGALFVWGSTTGPVAAAVVPSIVLYLQFAIFDRVSAGLGWMLASGALVALAVASVALDRKRDVGRARDSEGRPKPVRSYAGALIMASIVAVVAIAAANSASGVVSEYGNIPWRGSSGGFGGSGGGDFALQRFADLRQSLISRDGRVLFEASFDGRQPDPSSLYWKVENLDVYDSTIWQRGPADEIPVLNYGAQEPLGDPSNVYQGTTRSFTTRIRADNLANVVLPVPGAPTNMSIPTTGGGIVDRAVNPSEVLVLDTDSALWFPQRLSEGQQYEVTVTAALSESDFGALATLPTGELSPIFAGAAADGLFPYSPSLPTVEAVQPPDLDSYREKDEDVAFGVTDLALELTEGASTDFEAAWMLQSFFRDENSEGELNFRYDDQVTTGQDSLDMDAWLNDPASLNYRRGYCTQFATTMAVMAREIGLASRVALGFTPGIVTNNDNGSPEDTGDDFQVVTVQDYNAHAWVEIWIEPYGWVQFDPTPRRQAEPSVTQPESFTADFNPADYVPEEADLGTAPDQPTPADDDPFADIAPGFEESTGSSGSFNWWLLTILLVPLVIGAIPLAKRVRRNRRMAAIRNDGDITAAWDELLDRLEDVGHPVPASQTPVEFARNTDSALVPIATRYASTIYGGREGQADESDLYNIDMWINGRYQGFDRFRAAVNPKSLISRD